MTQLHQIHFVGMTVKQLNLYIETINEYLNEHIPIISNWKAAVKRLFYHKFS